MSAEIERSEDGYPIYRHEARDRDRQVPENFGLHLEEIEAHLEKHVGKVETVFHEIASDLIHLDVLFIPANTERPFHVLATSGVSDLPMKVPEGMEQFRRAELLMALPPEWPLTQKDFEQDANYWPIRWLKQIGRLPHEYETWIGWGHTIPNGDPAEPIADTNFIGVMVAPPFFLSTEVFQLSTTSGETISFYMLIPLYQEEMNFKLKNGAEALEEKLLEDDANFILNVNRRNEVKEMD